MHKDFSPLESRERGFLSEPEIMGSRCPRCGEYLEAGKSTPSRAIFYCTTCGYYYEVS